MLNFFSTPNTNALKLFFHCIKFKLGLDTDEKQSVFSCSLLSAKDRSNKILGIPRSNHKEQGKFIDNIIK